MKKFCEFEDTSFALEARARKDPALLPHHLKAQSKLLEMNKNEEEEKGVKIKLSFFILDLEVLLSGEVPGLPQTVH